MSPHSSINGLRFVRAFSFVIASMLSGSAYAGSMTCDDLEALIAKKPINRAAVQTTSVVYVSWSQGPFQECLYRPSEEITVCGGKRFLATTSNLLLGFPVLTNSGVEVDSIAANAGSRSTTCDVSGNKAIVRTMIEREFELRNLPVRYTVRQETQELYPFASMQF